MLYVVCLFLLITKKSIHRQKVSVESTESPLWRLPQWHFSSGMVVLETKPSEMLGSYFCCSRCEKGSGGFSHCSSLCLDKFEEEVTYRLPGVSPLAWLKVIIHLLGKKVTTYSPIKGASQHLPGYKPPELGSDKGWESLLWLQTTTTCIIKYNSPN